MVGVLRENFELRNENEKYGEREIGVYWNMLKYHHGYTIFVVKHLAFMIVCNVLSALKCALTKAQPSYYLQAYCDTADYANTTCSNRQFIDGHIHIVYTRAASFQASVVLSSSPSLCCFVARQHFIPTLTHKLCGVGRVRI